MTRTIITGAAQPAKGPTPPLRREIAELSASTVPLDQATFSLLIQAWTNLQAHDPNQPTSFFQLAGIHGLPFAAWDPQPGDPPKTGAGGYCTHSVPLFPTWHRPYLAALEQALQVEAISIAATYPDNQRALYQQAAVNLRLPFWDWATSAVVQSGVPKVLTNDSLTINTPKGPATVRNPLASYTFPPNAPNLSDLTFGRALPAAYPTTVRNPVQGKTNLTALNNAFMGTSGASQLRNHVCNVLMLQSWQDFSNNSTGGDTRRGVEDYSSIETLHNGIHGMVGGNGGHMGYPQSAAFDPIFWLHHCNIDRIFAIWQAINPSVYVQPLGTGETETTDLIPFHKNDAAYWSSDDCRDVKSLNYTYLELTWKVDPNQLGAQVCTLYGDKDRTRDFTNQFIAAHPGTTGLPQAAGVSSSASSGAPKPTGDINAPYGGQHPVGYPHTTGGGGGGGYDPAKPNPGYTPTTGGGGGGYGTTTTHGDYGSKPKDPLPHGYDAKPEGYGTKHEGYGTKPEGYKPADTKDPGYKPTADPKDPGYKPTGTKDSGYKPAGPKDPGYKPTNTSGYTHVENHHLKTYREWFAILHFQKNACNGAFTVFVFIGDVPTDPSKWSMAPSLCGVVHNFAQGDNTNCENCKKEPDVLVGGSADLTEVMMLQGIPLELEPASARLKKDLKIRIYKEETNEIIDAATISSLTLNVVSAAVELETITHESIKDAGNGYVVHRKPKRYGWVHHEELEQK